MPECTDAELVEAARNGDVNSFGELYRRHYVSAVGIAFSALSDHHSAEDAAQEAFAIACRDLGHLRSSDKFAAWLGMICRRTARRLARSRFRQSLPVEEIAFAPATDPAEEQANLVRQAVRQLPERCREVIVLHYFSGLSYEEMAAVLRSSPQAVHGRLIRARRKMVGILKANGLTGRKS